MKSKLPRFAAFTIALLGMAIGGYFAWRSTAVLLPDWTSHSPDSRFRIEFYSVWTPSRLGFTMPGQGSDNIDGFMRLRNANGDILNEAFRTFLRAYEAEWTEDEVYFLGDGPSWPLPKK